MSSTQIFTEVEDIVDEVVLLRGGNACSIIQITASNFALLSRRDQDTKIYAYAAFLNSLTFPIQILIRNKRVDVSSYIKLLEEQETKTTNQLLIRQIRLYREFVHEMVRVNVVLNKEFYVVISYSSLEGGPANIAITKGMSQKDIFVVSAKKSLAARTEAAHGQLRRFAVATKTLGKKELVQLYYDIFNETAEGGFDASRIDDNVNTPIVRAEPKK